MKTTINFVNKKKAPKVDIPTGHFLIYVPSLTMEEIVAKAKNKASDGKPLVYSNWCKKEPFYTTEKAREGWYLMAERLEGKDLNWNEQEALIKEKGGERLNAAEELYIQYAYEKVTGIRLTSGEYVKPYSWEYSWTSSRSSFGYVVDVGGFGAHGLLVDYDDPGYRHDNLGLRFSRRIGNNESMNTVSPTPRTEAEDLERAIEICKSAGLTVTKTY